MRRSQAFPKRALSQLPKIAGAVLLSLLASCGGSPPEEALEQLPESAELDFSGSARLYAELLQQLEAQRRATYQALLPDLSDGDREALNAVRCNDPDSVRPLSRRVRREVVAYCDRIAETIRDRNLTIAEFNEFEQAMAQGGEFASNVRSQLAELESAPPAPTESSEPTEPDEPVDSSSQPKPNKRSSLAATGNVTEALIAR